MNVIADRHLTVSLTHLMTGYTPGSTTGLSPLYTVFSGAPDSTFVDLESLIGGKGTSFVDDRH